MPPPQFETTRWSVVLDAGGHQTTAARKALTTLCETYWPPLYAFLRRRGHSPEDAQDLVQGFFLRFLEKNYLSAVDPERGKFRSFLLASLKHFLADEWDKAQAQKRGGGALHLSIDFATASALSLAGGPTPEKAYERQWALTVLDQALTRLQDQYTQTGKEHLFTALKNLLTAQKEDISYRQLAETLGLTEGAVKTAVHRLRRRYRKLLRAIIAETVATKGDVDEEMQALMAALGP